MSNIPSRQEIQHELGSLWIAGRLGDAVDHILCLIDQVRGGDNWIRVTPETMPKKRERLILWNSQVGRWDKGYLTDVGLAWDTYIGYYLISENVITYWQLGPGKPEELRKAQ